MIRNYRQGFTLIELIVFISVGSVIFFLSIQLIHLSMQISQKAKEQWQQDATLSRLSRDFRQDARQAIGFDLSSKTQLSIDSRSGPSVEWRVEDGRVRRLIQQDQKTAIEDYPLARDYIASLELEPTLKIIRLTVHRVSETMEQLTRIERLIECQPADATTWKTTTSTTNATEAPR